MMWGMDTPTPITPAGWYDDGHGQLRWWDGSRWTEHTAPLAHQQAQPQRAVAPQRPAARTAPDLVSVPRSKLVWILPLVMLLAALIGGLLGALAAEGISDTDPVEETYAAFLRAERTGDCAALERVTTPGFREDLVDDYAEVFTCEQWQARTNPRRSEIAWAMRLGPFGILVANEQFTNPPSPRTSATYYIEKRDGRWQLDDRDANDDY